MESSLPELPDKTIDDLVQGNGLTIKDAKTLVDLDGGERLDYFDSVLEALTQNRASKMGGDTQAALPDEKLAVKVANW